MVEKVCYTFYKHDEMYSVDTGPLSTLSPMAYPCKLHVPGSLVKASGWVRPWEVLAGEREQEQGRS